MLRVCEPLRILLSLAAREEEAQCGHADVCHSRCLHLLGLSVKILPTSLLGWHGAACIFWPQSESYTFGFVLLGPFGYWAYIPLDLKLRNPGAAPFEIR